jgi:protein SCO1/2
MLTCRMVIARIVLLAVTPWWSMALADGNDADRPFDARAALRASQAVVGTTVGEHALYDSAGNRVMLSLYQGQPVLVSFVYTGCTQVCPLTTKTLANAVASAQRAVGSGRFQILTIGFNLPYDTPSAMADFARRLDLRLPDWHFLSADAASVTRLTREFGFAYRATAGGFDHITQVTLVDGRGKIVRQIYGDGFDLPLLVEPLKQMLAATPQEVSAVAQMIDKIRLVCTVYDPASGQYRVSYAVAIEIGAGLSVIAGVLIFMIRGRRRAGAPRA